MQTENTKINIDKIYEILDRDFNPVIQKTETFQHCICCVRTDALLKNQPEEIQARVIALLWSQLVLYKPTSLDNVN